MRLNFIIIRDNKILFDEQFNNKNAIASLLDHSKGAFRTGDIAYIPVRNQWRKFKRSKWVMQNENYVPNSARVLALLAS